jgi:hypothetical protein
MAFLPTKDHTSDPMTPVGGRTALLRKALPGGYANDGVHLSWTAWHNPLQAYEM